jgi:aminomethyltransferase
LKNTQDAPIGHVTSGTVSPSLGYGIGLGYINAEEAQIGNEITVEVRAKTLKATLVKLPFLS